MENIVDTGLVDLSQKYYVARLMYEEWTSRIEVKSGDLIMTNAGRVGAVARIPDHVLRLRLGFFPCCPYSHHL